MARTVTLAQLRTDARLYADQRVHASSSSTYVSDTELTRLINLQLAEFHELLVMARGHDYDGLDPTGDTGSLEGTVTLTSGDARYSLPSFFFQMLHCELVWPDGERETLRSVPTFPDTTPYSWYTWGRESPKGYRIRGGFVEVFPTPTSTATLRMVYAPHFRDLSADGDTYDGVNGWEKLVTLGAAIELRTIENRPLGSLPQLYQQQRERIEQMAEERQAADPARVRDVERTRRWPWAFYSG